MKRVSRVVLYGVAGLVALFGVVWAIGYFLPAEHSVSVSREVAGTPREVWSVLTVPHEYPDWRPEVGEVEVLSDEGDAVHWRETTDRGAVNYRRVAAEAPQRLVNEIADQDLPYGGRWTYELESVPAGTRVTITEDGVVHSPLFRFFSRFVFGHDASARSFLESLHARMEEGR